MLNGCTTSKPSTSGATSVEISTSAPSSRRASAVACMTLAAPPCWSTSAREANRTRGARSGKRLTAGKIGCRARALSLKGARARPTTGAMTVPQPSPQPLAFADEPPWERRTILAFMREIAGELAPGSRLLDVGAGEQPYRELFGHLEYVTTDWANSVHPGARRVDIVAPAHDLPIEEGTFDAVVCTQVLEHVADPGDVLAELFRVLRPGGRLYVTVPLTWEEHEAPYDFFRYTRFGLEHLLANAGFADVAVTARNDSFSTVAQLLRNFRATVGHAADGREQERAMAVQACRQVSELLAGFAPLDVQRIL